MSNEIEVKTERLLKVLQENGLQGVLINAQHNFAWLTGGGSNGIDLSRENGAANLLVAANGKRYLLANNIEMPRMLSEVVSVDEFEPIEYRWQDEKANGNLVIEKAAEVCGRNVVSDYAVENKVAPCRYSLTDDEIVRYRSLGRDAASAVNQVIEAIATGETEIEIAEKLRHNLAQSQMASVVSLVAADERIGKYRHPIPTANRFEKMLLLVTCAKREGLIVSLSRIVCVGEPSDELKRTTDSAAYVNARLLDATRPGATGAELYRTAADAYAEQGFAGEVGRHHQGGAAGYRTREWVALPQSGVIVRADQAFAWNPSITGTKVEDTCIVTENGVEVITASPVFPQIATTINGREYLSHGIMTI